MFNETEFMTKVHDLVNADDVAGAVVYAMENGSQRICEEFVNNVVEVQAFIKEQGDSDTAGTEPVADPVEPSEGAEVLEEKENA